MVPRHLLIRNSDTYDQQPHHRMHMAFRINLTLAATAERRGKFTALSVLFALSALLSASRLLAGAYQSQQRLACWRLLLQALSWQ